MLVPAQKAVRRCMGSGTLACPTDAKPGVQGALHISVLVRLGLGQKHMTLQGLRALWVRGLAGLAGLAGGRAQACACITMAGRMYARAHVCMCVCVCVCVCLCVHVHASLP